jgi:hypothetical protein
MRRHDQVPAPSVTALNKLACIFALVLFVVLPARAQQTTDEAQKQIEQLKQLYEQTTRELQERIAAWNSNSKRKVTVRRMHQKKKEQCLRSNRLFKTPQTARR